MPAPKWEEGYPVLVYILAIAQLFDLQSVLSPYASSQGTEFYSSDIHRYLCTCDALLALCCSGLHLCVELKHPLNSKVYSQLSTLLAQLYCDHSCIVRLLIPLLSPNICKMFSESGRRQRCFRVIIDKSGDVVRQD